MRVADNRESKLGSIGMGVLYMVWPVDSEMRQWLGSQAIDAPETDSRWPSKQEVLTALNRLQGFQINVTDNGPDARWDAFVECPAVKDLWTLLQAKPRDGSDDVTEITFEKGHVALIVAVLRDLVRTTGPLVLMTDSGDDPLIIRATVPYLQLVSNFYDVSEESSSWRQLLDGASGASDQAA